jgi:hypothetical protein
VHQAIAKRPRGGAAARDINATDFSTPNAATAHALLALSTRPISAEGGCVGKRSSILIKVVLAVASLLPGVASAQQQAGAPSNTLRLAAAAGEQQGNAPAAQSQGAVEDFVERFGIGVQGGIGLDPELIVFGAHGTFAPIFHPRVEFRPGIDFGVGELTTTFGINLDVLYRLAGSTGRWRPYFGGGPNFALSHQDLNLDEDDLGDEIDDPNRFDFSDTDFEGGFNFIAGARTAGGMFVEMKATAYGVTNIRLLVGFNF